MADDMPSGLVTPAKLNIRDVDVLERADVVVVGFGIAGGSAALEAARAGAQVIVLERAATYGGTSAMSGGHFYLGGGTPVQVETGQADSAQEMAAYLRAANPTAAPEKVEVFSRDSVEHFGWIEALGFEFERSYYPEKAVIQPGTEGLMYTGNEKVWPFRDMAAPAPRGHKVPRPGEMGGTQMVMDLMAAKLAEAGVEVRYETGATNLVTNEAGDVVGVAWRHFDEYGVIATDAVVIAAGGFVMNADMVAEHVPQLREKPFTLGSTYDDGLGLRLGQSVGAELQNMDSAFITAPVYPPSRLLTGVIVNKQGERFVAEDSYHSRTSGFVMEQTDHAAYLIVDSEHIEHPAFPLCPFIDGWDTIEEMESGLGLPAGSLAATLTRYNENAAHKEDPDFHKYADWLEPQDAGPWGAYDMTLGVALYAGFTMGGMRTSIDGEVERADGSVVAGLYAAGACASNIATDGKGYASGLQLAEGSYFGRRAGRHAASRRGQNQSVTTSQPAQPQN
jgi:succinate dehydrogenase/fumarate reductase flavoprotein subunit